MASGTGRLRVGSEERPIAAGDCVVIPPGTVHRLWADADVPLVVVCCACRRMRTRTRSSSRSDRRVRETPEDLAALQALIDRSMRPPARTCSGSTRPSGA